MSIYEEMSNFARIVWSLTLLTLVGVLGFRVTEPSWSLLDCVYMTVITLTTVGYGIVDSGGQQIGLSDEGKIFVTIYLCVGVGVFLFSVAELGKLLVQGAARQWLETRRMENVKSSLAGHFIVCGFGRMGQVVCDELAAGNMPFIVLDRDSEVIQPCREKKWPFILGDCTEDRVLESAGIRRARGLVATLGSEADNLYVVLSARELSADSKRLLIVARTSHELGAAKLRRAGADQVVNLYNLSASRMARWLVNPNVQEFIELVTTEGAELDLAEISIQDDSPYAEATLAETDLRARGLIVVGIRSPDGALQTTPGASVRIHAGDRLIALGARKAMLELIRPGGQKTPA